MKSKLTRYIGRSILALVVTAMFTFGGLLVLTPTDEAEAGKRYSYTDCGRCHGHRHVKNF